MTACTQPALPCDSTPCQNGGTCVDEDDSYSCVCTLDFYGLNCDLDRDCSVNPCQNGGVCRVVDASIQCECTSGWSGLMCQQDVENPVLHVCPSDITLNAATGRATATANWNAPFASDNSGKVKVTSSYRSGAPFTIGETEVVYTATDPAGNTGNCSFTVVVRDVEKPVFAYCPDDIVRGIVTPDGEVRAQWTRPTATDNSGKVGLSWSSEPLDFFPVGVHRVIYTATDPSGNKQFCSFDISVEPLRDFTEDQLLRFEITLDVEFTVALTDRSSREFATVAAAVEDAVAVLIRRGNIEGFHMVVVTAFRRGSVVADVVLVFEEPANDVIRYKSLEAVYSDVNSGRIGDYAAKQLSAVSPTGERIEVNWCNIEPCPDHMNCTLLPDKCVAHCANNEHYCQNGGRCEVSVPDDLIRCICTSNYYGIRCEIPDIVNDAEAVTIMAALVWVGLLGSVVILFSITRLRRCCCRDRFQRPNFLRKDFFRDVSARDSPEDEEIVKAEKLPPENGVTEDVETMPSQSNFSLAHTDATENVQYRVDLTEAEDYL
ncbi:uncharacterized protein [Ptychodera flava]|uniref:uncharacterized protein n=1 Tax=Ptychodera flava TaxID=63121 RepID=UPI00396A17F3